MGWGPWGRCRAHLAALVYFCYINLYINFLLFRHVIPYYWTSRRSTTSQLSLLDLCRVCLSVLCKGLKISCK